jgi:hypothetical protein
VEDVAEFNSLFIYRAENGLRTKFFAESCHYFDFDQNVFEGMASVESNRAASNVLDIEMPVSIEVSVKNSDISVTKTQDGNSVIFTAEKCDSYSWTLDDKVVGTARSCVIDTTTLTPGTYSLALEATKGTKHYSYWAQLKCAYDAGGQSSTVSQLPGDNFDEKLFTTDRLQTSHVKVENVTGGLKFTITRPADDVFNPNFEVSEGVYGGFNWVGIARCDYINGEFSDWTTVASLPAWEWDSHQNSHQDTFTCFYPLCEPGERYVFLVTVQPENPRDHREFCKTEFISVIALDGIGDIDYSYLDESRKFDLQFDGVKPLVTISN